MKINPTLFLLQLITHSVLSIKFVPFFSTDTPSMHQEKLRFVQTIQSLQSDHHQIALGSMELMILLVTPTILASLPPKDQQFQTKYVANKHSVMMHANASNYLISHELHHAAMAFCLADFNKTLLINSNELAPTLTLPYSTEKEKKELHDSINAGDQRIEQFIALASKELNRLALSTKEFSTLFKYKSAIDHGFYFPIYSYTLKDNEMQFYKKKYKSSKKIVQAIKKEEIGLHIGDPKLRLFPTSVSQDASSITTHGYLASNMKEDKNKHLAFIKDHWYKKNLLGNEYKAIAQQYPQFKSLTKKEQEQQIANTLILERDAHIMQNKNAYLDTFYPELSMYHQRRCFDKATEITQQQDISTLSVID